MEHIRPEIPNFTITDFCGCGGSSEVWIGTDQDGVRRAIKVMDLSIVERLPSIEQENSAIGLYRNIVNRHASLLNIFYIGRTDRYLYYVTELADNVSPILTRYEPDTLEWRLRTRSFSISEAIALIEEIAEAVSFLHANGLAHRDLKPGNILFVHGKMQIGDPGLLCSANTESTAGTQDFKLPWKCSSVQSDIYALGKILYMLYSGRPVKDFPSLPPDCDLRRIQAVNAIALRCCEAEAKRYRSVDELLGDVRRISERAIARRQTNRRIFLLAGGFSLLLISSLALNVFLLLRSASRQRFTVTQVQESMALARDEARRGDYSQGYFRLYNLLLDDPAMRNNANFYALFSKLERHYLWGRCMDLIDPFASDMLMLTDTMRVLSPQEKRETFQDYFRLNARGLNSLSILYYYFKTLDECDDRPAMEAVLKRVEDSLISGDNGMVKSIYLMLFCEHFRSKGDLNKALHYADLGCQQEDPNHLSFVMRAKLKLEKGDAAGAAADLRTSLKLKPVNPVALQFLRHIPVEVQLPAAEK